MENSKSIWVLGHKIEPHKSSGNFDIVTGETLPNIPGPPPHKHKIFTELFIILEGEMEFIVEGKVKVIKAGNSIDLPINTIHTFNNKGKSTCKWLNIHSPKGFLNFFDKYGVDTSINNAFEKSIDQELIHNVIKNAVNYDMIIKEN